ncbi:MAG: response regulator [Alphaproteobacteria bacterium]|nr:response regulator [Alphaproteobacteria bacterium]
MFEFIQHNQPMIEAANAVSSVINIVGWTIGFVVLWYAWRRNSISSVSVGPISFQMEKAAMQAAKKAALDWQGHDPSQPLDMQRLRQTVHKAFTPDVVENLIGKSILWVDDNPRNNLLAVRAMRRLQLDIEQVASTEAAIAAMEVSRYDLVISDMGRGANMRAGYELLDIIRKRGSNVPFLIFAGDDKPEFRREAKQRGAQLSTNDMLELMDCTIHFLNQQG